MADQIVAALDRGAPITDSRRSRSSVVSRFGSKSRVRLLERKASLSTTATASPRAKALCRCASGKSSDAAAAVRTYISVN